jgi:hypothetical protein
MSTEKQTTPSTTVEDLVTRLRRVRYKMYNMQADGVILKKRPSRMLNPTQTVSYFNQCFQLDMDTSFKSEDQMACMLYDLANVPLEMVKQREIFSDDLEIWWK